MLDVMNKHVRIVTGKFFSSKSLILMFKHFFFIPIPLLERISMLPLYRYPPT